METGNARLAGLEKDLGLEGYDYNILLSVFYVSYAICRRMLLTKSLHNLS